jgi:hypothetical protein
MAKSQIYIQQIKTQDNTKIMDQGRILDLL